MSGARSGYLLGTLALALAMVTMEAWGLGREAPHQGRTRVLLLGDSNIHGPLGRYVETSLRLMGAEVTRRGKPSSGLCRPAFFDWHGEAQDLVRRHDPDVIVLVLGGNDGQDLASLDPSKPPVDWDDEAPWRRAYGERLKTLLRLLRQGDRRVIFLPPPNRESPNAVHKMMRIMEVQREGVRVVTGVRWVDLWRLTSDDYGRFLESGIDARGRRQVYRKKDGIHLTGLGSRKVGRGLMAALVREGVLEGREPPPAPDPREQTLTRDPVAP